jgi:ectoine hydroxylase
MSLLRRFKLVYLLNNLFHKKELQCNDDLYKRYGLKRSVTDLITSKDFAAMANAKGPWLDEPGITTEQISSKKEFAAFPLALQQKISAWPENGYMILPSFYSSEQVDTINVEITQLQQQKKAKNRLDERIIFAVRQSQKIYELATDKRLTDLLSFILGKKVKLFQSLNFLKGSEQRAHSDTIHMTTFPLGYLIAAWVALEDITVESGPLFYYKGSHKLPYVLNDNYDHGGNYFLLGKASYKKYENAIDAVIKKNELKKETFLAKKGDVFIWHANILHGGEKIINPFSSRKSMVLHFFTEEVICYHEITQRPAIFNGAEAHCPE